MIADTAKLDLTGKNIFITGGSLGIGYAATEACLAAGARVAICARGRDDLDRAAATLREAAGSDRVAAYTADVTRTGDVAAAMDDVMARWGPLDGVIHSAGIYGPIGLVTDVDPDEWMDVIRVNLFGAFVVVREGCKRMMESGGGRIALFAGGGAAAPFPNYTGYACSKAALVRLTETAAVEMEPYAIAINAIAPGFVVTRLHQQTLAQSDRVPGGFYEKTKAELERGGVAASVGGEAAAFLVSSAATGITGKFVAAPYDAYRTWPERIAELRESDIFTLRRIVPRDRGGDWQ